MTTVFNRIENFISKTNPQKIKNLSADLECEAYFGCSFQLKQFNIKFRIAKITPKKAGLFVTLWKRNTKKQTEPYHVNDNFDFYMIAAQQENEFGFFLFPKHILTQNFILTTPAKEGKRGFRVYPDWVITQNKQAQKTKSWQEKHFINLNNEPKSIKHFNLIINAN